MVNQRKQLQIALAVTTISFVLLTTATYAWMTMASTLRVTDLALNVVTDNALEVALDVDGVAGEFQNAISLAELFSDGIELRPVTYSALEDCFLVPEYGLDGRISSLTTVTSYWGQNETSSTTSPEAEENVEGGYLLAVDMWMRTGSSNCIVALSDPLPVTDTLEGGGTYVVGDPIWNELTLEHEDGGNGAQDTVRMAIRVYDENGDTDSFIIFEPNYDGNNTASVDGTETLVPEEDLITQTASFWEEQDPTLRDNVTYTLGELDQENNALFVLEANVEQKITLYFWIEGQDPQCTNAISGGQLTANIQFTGIMGDEDNTIVAR